MFFFFFSLQSPATEESPTQSPPRKKLKYDEPELQTALQTMLAKIEATMLAKIEVKMEAMDRKIDRNMDDMDRKIDELKQQPKLENATEESESDNSHRIPFRVIDTPSYKK